MTGIVLREKRLIYWPVPKNACTAIKAHIANRQGLTFDNPHTAPFEKTGHPLPGFTNVAIVRHPLRRLYSLWANKVAPGHTPAAEEVNGLDRNVFSNFGERFRSGMSFEDFVMQVILIPYRRANIHWLPQTRQLPPNVKTYQLERVGELLRLLIPEINSSKASGAIEACKELPDIPRRGIIKYYSADFAKYNYHPLS